MSVPSMRIKVQLAKTAIAQIVCDNDVSHCVEHELNVVGVCRAGHVAVDFFVCRLVLRFELCLDVGGSLSVFLRP